MKSCRRRSGRSSQTPGCLVKTIVWQYDITAFVWPYALKAHVWPFMRFVFAGSTCEAQQFVTELFGLSTSVYRIFQTWHCFYLHSYLHLVRSDSPSRCHTPTSRVCTVTACRYSSRDRSDSRAWQTSRDLCWYTCRHHQYCSGCHPFWRLEKDILKLLIARVSTQITFVTVKWHCTQIFAVPSPII